MEQWQQNVHVPKSGSFLVFLSGNILEGTFPGQISGGQVYIVFALHEAEQWYPKDTGTVFR